MVKQRKKQAETNLNLPAPASWRRRTMLVFLYKVFWRTILGVVIGLRYLGVRKNQPDGPVIYMMTVVPRHRLHLTHSVAAQDFFGNSFFRKWSMENLVNAVLISRKRGDDQVDPIEFLDGLLQAGRSLILFPEGTRGVAGSMGDFKRGVGHLASRHPGIPVIPIYLDGLYRNLPKGRAMIVPFGGNLIMGEPLVFGDEDVDEITLQTQTALEDMAQELRDANRI